MSPQPGRDPLGVLMSFAWSIFFVCVLLAAAVWLLQQIWAWLIAALVVTAALWVVMLWLRARRDRW